MNLKRCSNWSSMINKFFILIVLSISFCQVSAQIANIQTGVSMGSGRDHDLAISNSGWTINATNAQISFGGNAPIGFSLFMQKFGGTSTTSIIDPDIFYDPKIDRFFISGMMNSSPAGIIVLKSNTAIPTDMATDWQAYVYAHPPDAYLDFPRLAVNKDKVMVSFKHKADATSPYKPAFFTLDKMTLAAPPAITIPTVSSDMEFLCPVAPADIANFDMTDFYLIGMDKICTSGSNRIFVYHVDANNTVTEQMIVGSVNYYSNATGINSAMVLNMGRSISLYSNRAWGAVIKNNTIHFVSHILNSSLNQSNIYYGLVDINTNQLISTNLTNVGESRFFPSIALLNNPNNANIDMPCINFLAQNTTETLWKTYVHDGVSPHEYLISRYQSLGIPSNLGDYTSAQIQYNTPNTVWVSGQLPTESSGNQGYFVSLNNTIVPLELIDFKAQLIQADQVNLKWTTLSEINIQHFEVQRLSGKTWTRLATLKARNENNRQNYSFDDTQLENTEGVLYYRLKIVEHDNSFQYSPISAIKFIPQSANKIAIYPNPTTADVFIKSPVQGQILVEITDVLGRRVFQKNLNFSNTPLQIPISHSITQNGLYTVQLFQNTKLIDFQHFVFNR